MFERIKEAFETYSQSSPFHTDATLRTLNVKINATVLADKIIEILKELKYKTIRYNETFNEIFTTKAGFEVTINLIGSGGVTSIDVAIFSPSNRGKTRKALRFLLNKFKEEFDTYLSHE